MTEADIWIEMPSEPQICLPRTSVLGDQSPSKYYYQKTTNQSEEVEIVRLLNKAKFPVYLATYKNSHYAMKVFPIEEDSAKAYFKNEIRFSYLNHPNVIHTISIQQDKQVSYRETPKRISFILTEFAPLGDLFQFTSKYHQKLCETFIRTFFRDLIEGLQYIHSQGIAHLDLKLENLLVGEDSKLKIADFDLACSLRDTELKTKGSRCFRAPEMVNLKCKSPAAADIYSAGIILFVLKCGGILPHTEEMLLKDVNLYKLLNNNNGEFWKMHCMIQKKAPSFFSDDFKELFNGMTKIDPKERFTIVDIKKSTWYNGPIFSNREMKNFIQKLTSDHEN